VRIDNVRSVRYGKKIYKATFQFWRPNKPVDDHAFPKFLSMKTSSKRARIYYCFWLSYYFK